MRINIAPAAINHLLLNESRIREKIAAHAGKVACFDLGVITFRLKAGADGYIENAASDEPVQVTVYVNAADLPLILQHRDQAFSYVRIKGDADFANVISQVSQSIRWDAEADLSKWVGDVAAVRLVKGSRAAWNTAQSTRRKIAENIAEYFLEENQMLVRPQTVDNFAAEIIRLRDDVERLSKRIEKLKGNPPT